MNDEQKEWLKKYSSSIGAREYMRFMGVFVVWLFFSIAIFVFIFDSPLIFSFFMFGPFLFIMIAIRLGWRPAYRLMRRIFGNPNIPEEPMPRSTEKSVRQPRPWWSYLPSIWWLIVVGLLVYFAIKYFIRVGF